MNLNTSTEEEDTDSVLDIKAFDSRGARYPSSMSVLCEELIRRTIPRNVLAKLRTGKPVGVVLVVRSGWLISIAMALQGMCSDALHVVACKPKKSDDQIADAIRAFGAGAPVVHVTEDIANVPASVSKLSSAVYRLDKIDPAAVRLALQRCTRGRTPKDFNPEVSMLPLRMVAAAIVSGGRTRFAISALKGLSSQTVVKVVDWDLPRLEDCVEYGPLREWGLRLGADLKAWRRGELAASDLDSSILLVSPPGFGKTTFAKILTRHLDVKMFRLGIGEIFEGTGYLHATMQNITNAFEEARSSAPSILFLDEVDNFAVRSDASHGNDQYFNSLTNHILTLMDGIDSDTEGVVIIGATNRPNAVDPALLRPGRLSRTVLVPPADEQGREHILRTVLKADLHDVSLDDVVRRTSGFSAADLMHLVVRGRSSARSAKRAVAVRDLLGALEPDAPLPHELVRRIAIHEAGHAVCALELPSAGLSLVSATLSSSTISGGRTRFEPSLGAYSRSDLEDRVVVLLGGRAAEIAILGGEPTSGAGGDGHSDMARATECVATAIVSQGLYGSLLWRGPPENSIEMVNRDPMLRAAVQSVLDQQMLRATNIVVERQEAIACVASLLVEKGVATVEEIRAVLATIPKVPGGVAE